jgi:predicted TIM-barrel fold metal-dependent hydrolase
MMIPHFPNFPYFSYTDADRSFFQKYLEDRLPAEIFDAHIHINLPDHVARVPEKRWQDDWALECGHVLSVEDAYCLAELLFPNRRYFPAALPLPVREADLKENNRYLAAMGQTGKLKSFMAVRPEWDPEEVEQTLLNNGFLGFKPYPDVVSGKKGEQIGIFDFIPPKQWEILNRNKKAVMLHLPRKDRLADIDNIRELLEARSKYSEVTIIVAHLGRSFCPIFLKQGLAGLGSQKSAFFFDVSGVMNPEVFNIAFEQIPLENIMYGTDWPIFLWHGKREWTERTYINISREQFSWNTVRRSSNEKAGYTLILYEQLRAILDSLDRCAPGKSARRQIFSLNAQKILDLNQTL